MKPLKHKGFSIFEKSFYFGVYEAYLKNRMNHTSHLKISAKNTLFLAFIFRGSLNSPFLTFFSLFYSFSLPFTSFLSPFIGYYGHTYEELLNVKIAVKA
jgi:hypothetical protein